MPQMYPTNWLFLYTIFYYSFYYNYYYSMLEKKKFFLKKFNFWKW